MYLLTIEHRCKASETLPSDSTPTTRSDRFSFEDEYQAVSNGKTRLVEQVKNYLKTLVLDQDVTDIFVNHLRLDKVALITEPQKALVERADFLGHDDEVLLEWTDANTKTTYKVDVTIDSLPYID